MTITRRILVTGGIGSLGSKVAVGLVGRGHQVRAMSRDASAAVPEGVELAVADLLNGAGMSAAVQGVDTIVHCASSPFRKTVQVDVEGTAMLLDRLEREPGSNKHFFYISIVGVDCIPFSYYKAKYAAEKVIGNARVPWTILRATQFHELLDLFLTGLSKLPIVPAPRGFKYQLVDAGEVADHMVELIESGPAGRVGDIGGPEVLDIADIAARWLDARGKSRLVWGVPMFGKFAKAMRAGCNLAPDSDFGRKTFDQWLAERYTAT